MKKTSPAGEVPWAGGALMTLPAGKVLAGQVRPVAEGITRFGYTGQAGGEVIRIAPQWSFALGRAVLELSVGCRITYFRLPAMSGNPARVFVQFHQRKAIRFGSRRTRYGNQVVIGRSLVCAQLCTQVEPQL